MTTTVSQLTTGKIVRTWHGLPQYALSESTTKPSWIVLWLTWGRMIPLMMLVVYLSMRLLKT